MEKFCGNRECDNSSANFVCSRCQSEFYCSKKCQIDAFAGHRHNCFELPPLRPITNNDLNPKLSMMSLTCGNRDVQVIYCKEPEKQQVLQPVPVVAKKEVAVPPVPERQVKRAPTPVVSKQSEEISALQVQETKKQEEEDKENKKPAGPKATESRLREFPEPEPEERKVPEKEVKSKSNFVSSLVNKQQPKEAEDSRFYYKDLKQRPLPAKEFIANFLFGEIEKKIFSIVDSVNAPILEAVDAIVIEITKDNSGSPYIPKQDELVLAKFEGTFYRAVCKEVQGNAFLMNYIDYGNEAIVLEQGIRKFDKKLMEFDIVVHKCFMENFPNEINDNVSKILSQEGIAIVNATKGTKEGTFVAQILGL